MQIPTNIPSKLPAAAAPNARAVDGDYKTKGVGHEIKDADGDYKPQQVKAASSATASSAVLYVLSNLKKGG